MTDLHFSLGKYIRNHFGLWAENHELIESCRQVSGNDNLDADGAAGVIIETLWEGLKKTHTLRMVR